MSVSAVDVRWLFRALTGTATALALLVIVFGAFVRLSDAGLGCPDWPGCYGHVSVPQSNAALARAMEKFPGAVIESRKAWIEMVHRYLAGTLGSIVLVIAAVAWRCRVRLGQAPVLPGVLVGLIAIQALFGMWTVTYRLMPLVVTLHLLGGMGTLALLVWLLARQRVATPPTRVASVAGVRLRRWAGVALAVLFCQIALGGWVSTNYAGLACAGDPFCHGAFAQALNFAEGFSLRQEPGVTANGAPLSQEALNAIQWTHRMGAVITVTLLGVVAALAIRAPRLRKHGVVLLGLAVMQASVGIANVLYVLPLPLAVAHNALAASLLIVLVTLTCEAASAYRAEV